MQKVHIAARRLCHVSHTPLQQWCAAASCRSPMPCGGRPRIESSDPRRGRGPMVGRHVRKRSRNGRGRSIHTQLACSHVGSTIRPASVSAASQADAVSALRRARSQPGSRLCSIADKAAAQTAWLTDLIDLDVLAENYCHVLHDALVLCWLSDERSVATAVRMLTREADLHPAC